MSTNNKRRIRPRDVGIDMTSSPHQTNRSPFDQRVQRVSVVKTAQKSHPPPRVALRNSCSEQGDTVVFFGLLLRWPIWGVTQGRHVHHFVSGYARVPMRSWTIGWCGDEWMSTPDWPGARHPVWPRKPRCSSPVKPSGREREVTLFRCEDLRCLSSHRNSTRHFKTGDSAQNFGMGNWYPLSFREKFFASAL